MTSVNLLELDDISVVAVIYLETESGSRHISDISSHFREEA